MNLPLALCNLAAYEYRLDRFQPAREAIYEALLLANDEGLDANVALAIQYAASLANADGRPENAARLLEYADARFREDSLGRETTEQWMFDELAQRLRERLGIPELERLLRSGSRMSAAQAFGDALAAVSLGRPARAGSL